MNYELTTQEKINALEKAIWDLKEIPFNSFSDNTKQYLINTLEKEIEFLTDAENILQLDMMECNQYDVN